MGGLVHGLIYLLEALFAFGTLVCLLAVIPVTAYRLFMVLSEPDPEEDHPTSINQRPK